MGVEAVIPPKRNHVARHEYDRRTYKRQHLVESAFMRLDR